MRTPLEILTSARAGGFISAVWQRDCKTRKDVTARIQKRVAAHSLTFGVVYDNRQAVQDGRENGSLPAENAGLKGFEWQSFPRILRAVKTGKLYARLNVTAKSRFSSVWFMDGKRVDRQTVAPFLLASEMSSGDRPLVLNVGVDNLCAVRA